MSLLDSLLGLPRAVGDVAGRRVARRVVAALEPGLRARIEAVLDGRVLVREAELRDLRARAAAARDATTAASSELAAVTQAVEAHGDGDLGEALGLGPLPVAVDRLDAHREQLRRRAERLAGALDAAASQVEALAGRVAALSRPN